MMNNFTVFSSRLLLLLSLCYSCTVQAQSSSIVLCSSDSIRTWMIAGHIPTLEISLIEGGKVTQAAAYGNMPDGRPATPGTIFSIASLTKPVVAMTVLEMVDAGKLSLDEPLSAYWIDPDVKDNPWVKKLTPRIVLSHQTGFPNWRREAPSGKLNFEFEPGTKFQYSGEGMEYLRRALTHQFNQPLEQLSAQYLFAPLGLTHTGYLWSQLQDSTTFAGMYDDKGKAYPKFALKEACAAYGILTTTTEYAKIGIAAMQLSRHNPALFGEMVRTQVEIDSARQLSWGLGWALIKGLPGNEYALYHTGVDAGIRTVVILLPHSNRGMVIFTNGDKGEDVYNNIIKSSLDVGPELVKRVTF